MLSRLHTQAGYATLIRYRSLVGVRVELPELRLEGSRDAGASTKIRLLRTRHHLQRIARSLVCVGLLAIRFPSLTEVLVALLHPQPGVTADLVLFFPDCP